MNKNTQSKNRNDQSNSKRETKSSIKLRFFYILMLLLTIFSLVLRVSGARQGATAQASRGTAARVLVFHLEETNSCEDLAVTSSGGAVFSNCGNGMEKQYALNASERAQLQAWVEKYSPVNYEHNNPGQVGPSKTQLYLNGRGNRQADQTDIQQLINFAEALASKIVSQS